MADGIPAELEAWVSTRIRLISARVRAAQRTQHDTDDARTWVLDLLKAATDIQTASEQLVHLLTAYGLRSGVATQAEIARATQVTITGARNRALGRVAHAAWREIWPKE